MNASQIRSQLRGQIMDARIAGDTEAQEAAQAELDAMGPEEPTMRARDLAAARRRRW